MSVSPDAAIFAALVARGRSPKAPDPTALVLRMTDSVQELTALLRDAAAQLAASDQEWAGADVARLAGVLAQAERASRRQADCTAALLREVSQLRALAAD